MERKQAIGVVIDDLDDLRNMGYIGDFYAIDKAKELMEALRNDKEIPHELERIAEKDIPQPIENKAVREIPAEAASG